MSDEKSCLGHKSGNVVGVEHKRLVEGVHRSVVVVTLSLSQFNHASEDVTIGIGGIVGNGLVGISVGLIVVAELEQAHSLIAIDG